MTQRAVLADAVAARLAVLAPDATALGAAVSGGSDSMALLHLLADVAQRRGLRLEAATVNHGLRPEAQDEAAQVAAACALLGVPHRVLIWDDWAGKGNLQAAARTARAHLLAGWARERDLAAVCLGHTLDDQAETLLLRLMRGSGVDGLAAMAERTERARVVWLRPLLATRRSDLRDMLQSEDLGWCEDPSNTDPRFDRVRVRQAIATLGLDVPRLAQTSRAMARAREALGLRAAEVAQGGAVTFEAGDILLDLPTLEALDAETCLRLLGEALRWVAGADYRPRLSALEALWSDARAGKRATLHGCCALPRRDHLRICREYQAVAGTQAKLGDPWDGRWRLTLPSHPAAHVRALGHEGLEQVERPREGPPHTSLLATPAIWEDGQVLSVPRLQWGLSGRIDSAPEPTSYISRLIQH